MLSIALIALVLLPFYMAYKAIERNTAWGKKRLEKQRAENLKSWDFYLSKRQIIKPERATIDPYTGLPDHMRPIEVKTQLPKPWQRPNESEANRDRRVSHKAADRMTTIL